MAKGLGVEQRRQWVTQELARLRERQGGGRVGVLLARSLIGLLAEVEAGRDGDALLANTDRQHLLVWEARRVLAGDRMNIMAQAEQIGDQAKAGALIEQEPHGGRWVLAPFQCPFLCCPVTSSLAYARQE